MNRRRDCIAALAAPIRLNWFRAIRSAAGAEYVAGGVAVGTFLACYPLFTLHFPLAVVLARLLGVSRLAALAASMTANPITAAPLYALAYGLGTVLVPGDDGSPLRHPGRLLREGWSALGAIGLHDLGTLLVGCTMLALPATFLARLAMLRWLRRRATRRKPA